MTDFQFESRDNHMTTTEYDADFCFPPDFLVIGDPILLEGFKMGDEVLDQAGLGAIFIGHSAD